MLFESDSPSPRQYLLRSEKLEGWRFRRVWTRSFLDIPVIPNLRQHLLLSQDGSAVLNQHPKRVENARSGARLVCISVFADDYEFNAKPAFAKRKSGNMRIGMVIKQQIALQYRHGNAVACWLPAIDKILTLITRGADAKDSPPENIMFIQLLALLLVLILSFSVFGQHGHGNDANKSATIMPGMGDVYHPVSTKNAEAQKFFNQGLAFIYGFNHEEAVRSFKRAAELDPKLMMAYWGIALALGSNYNLQADAPQLKEAFANLQKALELAPSAGEHERAYIEALAKRYSSDPNVDTQKLAADYKAAMADLVKKYPDDLDAATLYAESMMNLRPWKLWTPDGKPAEGTLEIVAVLEGVLKRNPNHTGANHYYIHAIEASQNAERGLASAARLGKLAPKAGHLVHMPSHIYIRTGDYTEAAQSNADAIVADREYVQKTGSQGIYTMMYYNHNIHFLASAEAMKGNYAAAMKSARELEASVKPHIKAMPMLEMFMPSPITHLVRFGKWEEILKEPKPDYGIGITVAYLHFARGSAYAARGQAADAENELKAFQTVSKSVPADAPLGNSLAADVLRVAENVLAGKIALARGDQKAGLDLLRKAVEAEDKVSYNEPPDWDLPARETLGGVLLQTGNYTEAEQVFRAEIAKHVRNGRALFGLVESLKKQGKTIAAQMVQTELEKAWADADTKMSIEALAGLLAKPESAALNENTPRFDSAKLKTGIRLHYGEQGDPKIYSAVIGKTLKVVDNNATAND